MSATGSEDAVYSVLARMMGTPRSTSPTASLIRDLGLGSMEIIDFFFEIEKAAGVTIELNRVMGEMRGGTSGLRFDDLSIQDVVDYLDAHRK